MDSQLCLLEKYYLYYTDSGETQMWRSNSAVYTFRVYAASRHYSIRELNEVRLGDGSIEYVEQLCDRYIVHKEIPKHWLLRVLAA